MAIMASRKQQNGDTQVFISALYIGIYICIYIYIFYIILYLYNIDLPPNSVARQHRPIPPHYPRLRRPVNKPYPSARRSRYIPSRSQLGQ
ncbi:hypothetical protein I7I53_00331 [Histoplasma capsulatum var. duboisii H88]|uniref:Uncharacterized protein n=1 Tax=Ajellomyces capsulatus (strain H88) TaxID=544711 RepID=A0A8A1LMQ0_AJEC8|nr:hypothetical protein I7I53_00331 [Histoplasma capsulatum var. duboisii H88]